MLKDVLENYINFIDYVETWEDAIKIAAKPLVDDKLINSGYIDAMIQSVYKNGPYIVIIDGLALPHSKSIEEVNKTCLSLLKLKKSVLFPEEKKVNIIIVLGAKDNDTHIDLLSELTNILIDEEKTKKLFSANSKSDILEIL